MTELHDPDQLQKLIGEFLSGSNEVYAAIENRIRRFVYSRPLSTGVDKSDIVADVIAALYENLKANKFHGDSLKAFEVYIFSIAKNTISKYHRKLGRIQFWAEIPEQEPTSPYDSGVTKKDLSEKILDSLDESCRKLLELKFRQYWSDQELADKYGKTKNAMSTAISRCVKKARNLEIVKNVL
ncbi:MAG: sigma-70 family RNA polymerase sigma factor [FCB group bacterium]|nr:sigma-70 family RNA polymerase sigma factor [FCB group bacterium]